MGYKWAFNKYPVAASLAGAHLEEMEKEYGEVTPQLLLEDSRPEGTLMHCCFEWNDGIAAEKYRLEQSRHIIADLRVVQIEEDSDKEPVPVRAFISTSPGRTAMGIHHHINVVKANAEMTKTVTDNAREELEILYAKYNNLCDFLDVMEEFVASKRNK